MSLALHRLFLLGAFVMLGCYGQGPYPSPEARWSAIEQLNGWQVCDDVEEAVKQAHLKRHPDHFAYKPISEVKRLAPHEETQYGAMNEILHDKLRGVSITYFENFSVPKEIQKERGEHNYFSPFTYQNYDWYGPSYECPIVVLTDYLSAELIQKFQSFLQGEHEDWCIYVSCSDSLDFGSDHVVAIFSDQVLVPATAVEALRVPERFR